MSNTQTSKLPVWFWTIAAIALIWNLMGIGAYVAEVTKSAEAIAALPAVERALYENIPSWVVGAFAVAVFGGALGCILLLLRNKLSVPIFGASLVGILVQMFHSFFIANSMAVYGPSSAIMPVMVVVISVFLVWFSMSSKRKGWIK